MLVLRFLLVLKNCAVLKFLIPVLMLLRFLVPDPCAVLLLRFLIPVLMLLRFLIPDTCVVLLL